MKKSWLRVIRFRVQSSRISNPENGGGWGYKQNVAKLSDPDRKHINPTKAQTVNPNL